MSQLKPKIKLHAEANKQIGLGHIFRMIALSNLLENNFECAFIILDEHKDLIELLKQQNCKLQFISNNISDKGVNNLDEVATKNDIVVLDGYHYNTDYQQHIKNKIRCKLVCVDDIFSYPFVADVIINHAGGVTENNYKISSYSKLLLGPSYAILRKEFYAVETKCESPAKIKHVFLNFGGSDPDNNTGKVVQELLNISDTIKISVVIGAAYGHHTLLKTIVKQHSSIKVYKNISAEKIVHLMKEADTAICSASTISYEFCSITGLLFLVQTADNQSSIFNFLISEKLALPYTWFNKMFFNKNISDVRKEQVANQRKYFDGLAGTRLQKEFILLYLKNNYFIRKAVAKDVDTYFKWANDKGVRENSFNSEPIAYSSHCKWFNTALQRKDTLLYIFTSGDNIPIASIRFKKENDKAALSYLIDENFRGIGFGKRVIEEGTQIFFEENKEITKVIALVKNNNIPSIKGFQACEFEEIEYSKKNVKCFIKKLKT